MMTIPLSTSLGLAEAWLITLIALLCIAVGGALLYWQHRAAGRPPAAREPAPSGYAAVALELDSEAQAVLRLIGAYGRLRKGIPSAWRRPIGTCPRSPPRRRSASSSSF